MRDLSVLRRLTAAGLACALLAAAIGGLAYAKPGGTSAQHSRASDLTCDLVLYATIPQPAPTAANFGSADCGKPFGHGVQEDSSTVTRTSLTTGSFTGPFKMYFDRGSVSGTYTMSFVTTLSPTFQITNVDYEGTLTVTAGTGKNKHVRGTGTITGNSKDAKKTLLQYKLKLTGIAPGSAR